MNQSVLLQAMVYLASGVLFVPIAKRLGLGSVLGYLLAIIIGTATAGLGYAVLKRPEEELAKAA